MKKPELLQAAAFEQLMQQIPTYACETVKNPLLKDLRTALLDYTAAANVNNMTTQRDAMGRVVMACTIWLDEKRSKSSHKHYADVRKIRDEALPLYAWLAYTVARDARAQPLATTPLTQGYAIEGKQKKGADHVSFFYIKEKLNQMGITGEPSELELDQAIQTYLHDPGAVRLKYYRKHERLGEMLFFIPEQGTGKNRIHKIINGELTLFSTPPDGNHLWAADEYGNFYTTSFPPNAKLGQVHHSTLLHGKPVLCAGMIAVRDGVLRHIDNNSGHYQPDLQALLLALKVLRDEHGIDLTRARVFVIKQKYMKIHRRNVPFYDVFNSAEQFLNGQGSGPDEKDQKYELYRNFADITS